jgi:hypothetical protein
MNWGLRSRRLGCGGGGRARRFLREICFEASRSGRRTGGAAEDQARTEKDFDFHMSLVTSRLRSTPGNAYIDQTAAMFQHHITSNGERFLK